MGGLPRYLATARLEDPERIVLIADTLISPDATGPVVLLQVGRASAAAIEVGRQLQKVGRRTVPLIIRDREGAQSDLALSRLVGASAVWVFADDMLETFLTLYATDVAFHLRSKAQAGLPVVGVGGGAVSLGGLLLASRVCHQANYDLVAGLGWAARVFVDCSVVGYSADDSIARMAVESLPGLLAIQLGDFGGVLVEGGRIESIGTESVMVLGGNGNGSLMMLELKPGMKTTIAPPPFAPFESGLLPPDTVRALARQVNVAQRVPAIALASRPAPALIQLRQAPAPSDAIAEPIARAPELRPVAAGGRYCAMCKKVHGGSPQRERIELAA
jgi:hypothetical protein